jgi:hypothetical protein
MTQLDDAARSEASAHPLIMYVHVPKTAGSTISRILGLCTPRGTHSVHLVLDHGDAFLGLARDSDWIGGHEPRDNLANHLIWLDRPVEYFASVREPSAQLASHLNFSFERYCRINYYDQCTPDDQQIDAEVMSIDFANPAAIISLLLRHAGHYLNIQSRYVLGLDFAAISDNEIRRRLATYTYVASEYDLPKLYRAFGFAELPEGVDEFRENVAKYYFDTRVFDSPKLREFLAYHHRHDHRLYAAVRGASWSAERRRPFRPSSLEVETFTSDNFDEQTYLYWNRDVATAVKQGHFKSGRAHFEEYGCKENRKIRRWVPASVSESIGADFSGSAVIERLRGLREERTRIAAGFQLQRHEPPKKTDHSAVPTAPVA